MKSKYKYVLLTVFLFLTTIITFGQSGTLDPTFGNQGTLTTDLGGMDRGTSVKILADGKILLAGGSFFTGFSVARYHPDGVLDMSFGMGGKVTTNLGVSCVRVAMVVLPDGKFILAGRYVTSLFNGEQRNVMIRYHSNGTIDNSFGSNGYVYVKFRLDSAEEIHAIALQPDGKIIVGGYSYGFDTYYDFAMARYNSTGTLDYNFGFLGKVITAVSTTADVIYALAVQPDGKILAGGTSKSDFGLARYLPNGDLDNSFSWDGIVRTNLNNLGEDDIRSIIIMPNGKILAGGTSRFDFGLARYHPNGSLDNSFNNGGIQITSFNAYSRIRSVVIQPDGKIVAAGWVESPENDDFALARYHADGTLDESFGINGKVATDFGGTDDLAYSLALQSNEKLVVGGISSVNFALARYISELEVGTVSFSIANNSILIYPNPLGDQATLAYNLEEEERISIRLHSLNGQVFRIFMRQENRSSGSHEEVLDFTDVPPGSYFIVIDNNKGKCSIKVIR